MEHEAPPTKVRHPGLAWFFSNSGGFAQDAIPMLEKVVAASWLCEGQSLRSALQALLKGGETVIAGLPPGWHEPGHRVR